MRKEGWFCAQARANADGRALWCRTGGGNEDGGTSEQVAQFLLDRDDRLAWAWFPSANPEAAAAALSGVWPGAGDRVRQEVEHLERDTRDRRDRPLDAPPRAEWRDARADYDYSATDGLVVTARDASVPRWPFGADHYATTMSSAVDDLLAGGYDCFYPPQESCDRPSSNGYFRVTLRGDQIVTARFGIGGQVESGRQRHPLGQEFPNGLTFLTEAVRVPVTERIEQARRTGTGFTGIVAGTPLVIDADVGGVRDGDFVAYFRIQIGVPLAATLPV